MRPARASDDYRPVIGPVEAYLYGSDGQQRGDPREAALAMMEVVDSADPPLRLLLGTDAISLWEAKRKLIDADPTRWRATSEATAFGDAVTLPVGG